MNLKRMVVASVMVFIAFQVMDFFVHGKLLVPVYKTLTHLWRPDMMAKMWIYQISSFIMSILFVYIFTKGYENKGILEGARFGLITGLFMNVVGVFGGYAMYPIPFSLALMWFAFGMAQFIICGVIAALVYRPKVK